MKPTFRIKIISLLAVMCAVIGLNAQSLKQNMTEYTPKSGDVKVMLLSLIHI